MKRQNPSIFNDIVGPIMIGPSSSHTCGPSRIGYLAQQMLPGTLKKATVAFAKDGAYTLMYKGQRSDMGYVNGLLGRRPEDPALRNAFADAKEAGVDIQFVIEDFPPIVPNISHLILENTEGRIVEVHSDSTGGGTVKLLQVDGFPISIVGDCYEILIFTNLHEEDAQSLMVELQSMLPPDEGNAISTFNGNSLINLKQRAEVSDEFLYKIESMEHVTEVRYVKPILAVPSNRHATFPFVSASEMLDIAAQTGKELWELGIDYEMARSGWTYDEVWKYMEGVINTMEHSSKEALKGNIDMAGIIKPTAGKVENYIKKNPKALDMGVLNTAVPWAMATMEYSSAMGVVLCAPTGGSAGIFPGAVLGVANHMGLSLE